MALTAKGRRQKGLRVEREIVGLHTAMGVNAERVPLSGSAGGSYTGDVIVDNQYKVEVKSRKEGKGFALLQRWLQRFSRQIIPQDNLRVQHFSHKGFHFFSWHHFHLRVMEKHRIRTPESSTCLIEYLSGNNCLANERLATDNESSVVDIEDAVINLIQSLNKAIMLVPNVPFGNFFQRFILLLSDSE